MSDNYIVMYSPAAQEDVRSIFSYIAYELQAEQAAKGQVQRIRDIIRKLDVMPDRYAVMEREPWKSMGMRKLPVDNYIVFYIVDYDKKVVTVVRVVYGGRNLEEELIDNHPNKSE